MILSLSPVVYSSVEDTQSQWISESTLNKFEGGVGLIAHIHSIIIKTDCVGLFFQNILICILKCLISLLSTTGSRKEKLIRQRRMCISVEIVFYG